MKKKRKYNIGIELLLWLAAIIYLFPLYLQITIALKGPAEFARNPYGLPKKIVWSNILKAAKEMETLKVLGNSLIVLAGSLLVIVLTASLASYAIARSGSKIYRHIYVYFLAGMMVPFQLTMIPLYKVIKSLNMMATYHGVILIYAAVNIPLAITIMTGFMRSIPGELDEAAKIDGAGDWKIYYKVILPLVKAPVTTVIIFSSVGIWNDLLTPMLFLGSGKSTIVMSLYYFKGAAYTTDWTMVFAGSLVALLPLLIVFLFMQRYFIEGMVAGAIKG